MLNYISLMGRLVREPELRRTGSGIAVASFTLAVERDFKESGSNEKKTDYIDCVAWRQAGEFAAKYLAKGRMAAVSGRLQIRDWTDKDGNKRRSAEVKVGNVYFADSKTTTAPAAPQASAPFTYGGSLYPAPADASPDFQLLEARIRHTAESHNYPQGIAVSIMNHNALGYHFALYYLDLRRVNHAL